MTVEALPISLPDEAPVQGRERSPLAFIGVMVVTFVGVLGASFWLNVKMNPRQTFPSAVRPPRTDRSGHCRELENLVAAGKPPQVIVLGSSRTMQIRPFHIEKITGKRTFNFGVGGATPLDALTQLRYAIAAGAKPEMVIAGVDQDGFNADHSEFEFGLFSHWPLFKQVPFPENLSVAMSVIKTVSPDSTWKSVQAMLPRKWLVAVGLEKKKPAAKAVKAGVNVADHVTIENGYFIYRTRALQQAKGEYDLEHEIQGAIRKWPTLPNEKRHIRVAELQWRRFEQFVDLAKQNGIELKVMLLPVNPEYERAVFVPEVVGEREQLSKRIAALCASRGATYRDFTDVGSYDGDPRAFWDHIHQQPDNISRMINVLFGLPPGTYLDRSRPDALPTDVELLERLKKEKGLER